jgi:opacity protein-like surface antigen
LSGGIGLLSFQWGKRWARRNWEVFRRPLGELHDLSRGWSVRKRALLGSSALAVISINFIADFALSQEPGISPAPVTTGQPPVTIAQAPEPAPPSAPSPAPAAPPPAPAAPAAPEGGPALPPGEEKPLPQISVEAKRVAPRPAAAVAGRPAQNTNATPAANAPPVATPYETGAPNVGGGSAAPPQMASQMTVSGQDINARPIVRPGEVVEAAPGLIAIEHSDGGKANQYYLRGWNLDHGTDLAVFVDDVPINLPSHVHGQGYTDLNWLIPEAVGAVEIRKGPYFADVGDFENAGNLHISLVDSVDKNIVSITAGSFGYMRYMALGSTKVDGGGNLLYAGEFNSYNGPWTTADDVRKFSGIMRYSQGTATDGVSVTAAAYTNNWNAADQIPLRTITTGQVSGLYGEINPADGGDTSRFSLSARMAQSDANGLWKANVYFVKYTVDLFNDFGYFTADPVNGDMFHQHESRIYTGAGVSRTIEGTLWGRPNETLIGLQTRYDDINDGISNIYQRQFLSDLSLDHVKEGNAGIYFQNTMHWTDWFKTTSGWRGDTFAASVDSILQPGNSGKDQMTIGSPKFTLGLGPFYKTEFFAGVGMGYHSNDARGAVAPEVPGNPTQSQTETPLLVRSRGGEVGIRTKAIPNLDSSISVFYLHQDSELFFNADAGTTAAGPPSQRTGIEITNNYQPAPWVKIDGNLALSRARFLGFDYNQEGIYQSLAGYPQAQIGNLPGNYVYNAPWMVASGGITVGEKTGWFSSLRWRYFSARPLTEDGTFKSPPFNTINGSLGYRFENGWRIQLDALNMLNSSTDQATYAYGALVPGDNLYLLCNQANSTVPKAVCANGVTDYVMHPLEPLAFRLTFAGPIETLNAPAMAAELQHAFPAYQPPPAHYNWTGFYLGAHVAGGWAQTGASAVNGATGAAVSPGDLNPSAWHGGVQLGYDYMTPSRVVIGIAGDLSSGGRKSTTITDASGTYSIESNVFDTETLRGRLGYAVENILLYGTGGLAWSSNQYIRSQISGALNLATAGTDEAVNKYLSGWTAGVGLAYAFAPDWNAFAEYRHTSYGAATLTLPFSQVVTTFKTDVDEIDFGVNYKFDWNAPPRKDYTLATNLARKAPVLVKAPPAAHANNWTGFYVGGDGGYGWGRSNGILATAAGVPLTPYGYGFEGPTSGGFVGGNYQFNRIVVGAEGDWQWSNLTGNSQQSSSFTLPPGTFPGGPFAMSTTLKDYASIRGRLGYAFDRFLFFGTAGWAWGKPSTAYALTGSPPFFFNQGTSQGWTAGAGVDYAITDDVFARLEYRYTNLTTPSFVDVAWNSADGANKVPISDFRAGFALKFNGVPMLANF